LYSTTVKACSLRSCGGPVSSNSCPSLPLPGLPNTGIPGRKALPSVRPGVLCPVLPHRASRVPWMTAGWMPRRMNRSTAAKMRRRSVPPRGSYWGTPDQPDLQASTLVCHPSRPALARAEVWGSVLARPVQGLRYGGSTRVMVVQLGSEVIWAGSQSLRRAGTELPGTSGRMQLSLPARGTPRCGRNRLVLARCSLGLTVIAVSPRQMPGLTMRPGRRGAVIRRESCPGPSLSC
jgi:hypothetical protein